MKYLISFILLTSSLFATTQIELSSQKSIRLSNKLSYLPHTPINTFSKIVKTDKTQWKHFHLMSYEPYFQKTIWLKVILINKDSKDISRVIRFYASRVNTELYLVKNKTLQQHFALKANSHELAIQTLKFDANSTYELYFRLQNTHKDGDFYKVFLDPPESYFDNALDFTYLMGVFVGFIITIIVYNFNLYLSTKEKSYLYYVLFQVIILCFITDIESTLLGYFSNFYENIILFTFSWLEILAYVISAQFNREFLNTKKFAPILDRIIKSYILIALLLGVFNTFNFKLYPLIDNLSLFMFVYIISGILSFRRGNKIAIFYTLGWFFFVIIINMSTILRLFDAEVSIDFLHHFQLASALEALFLSLALHYKIRTMVKERHQQEQMLLAQSRLAAMGEMIGNIAHQWRQPLNHLSYIFINLESAQEYDELDKPYLQKKIKEANTQLDYMSSTIEDFKNFFAINKQVQEFELKAVCEEALSIMSASIQKHQLQISLNIEEDFIVKGHKNEFAQVLTILISNAKDAFIQNNIKERKLNITLKKQLLVVEDNAGGIPSAILEKIFDPYFTTKDKSQGTGLGLYMAKMIVENNMKANIKVHNIKEGARFSIFFGTACFVKCCKKSEKV